MKKIIFVFVFNLGLSLLAQENFVYTEAGGAGPMLSINYESTLVKDTNWTYKIGYGYATAFDVYHTLPVGVSYLKPIERGNYFELGMGYTHVFQSNRGQSITGIIAPNMGVRIFDGTRRLFFRFNVNPLIVLDDSARFFPWGGISMGIRL